MPAKTKTAAVMTAARPGSVTAGNIRVDLSNAGKVFFPGDEITKGDVIGYYRDVASRMLPYLRDRPIAMARYPDGLNGQRIFQKNVPDYFPGWVSRAEVSKQDGRLQHVICDKPATLVYLANQACIELHVFLSLVGRLGNPDHLVFDLDPPDDQKFGDVRQAALALRDLLDGELGLTAFVKTTGGKGLLGVADRLEGAHLLVAGLHEPGEVVRAAPGGQDAVDAISGEGENLVDPPVAQPVEKVVSDGRGGHRFSSL